MNIKPLGPSEARLPRVEDKLLQIDPGLGGTHSVDRKLTQDMAEHTLPIKNRPRPWQNTFCQLEFHLGHGGTPSSAQNLTWDAAEHPLPTVNLPRTWWNVAGN